MNVTIRNAKYEEAEQLAQIEASCFPEAEAATGEAIAGRMREFPENFYVAETEEKEIIGFINGACTDSPHLPDAMYHDASLHVPQGAYQTVFGLDVLPAYRRQKVARRLLETLLCKAKERGCKGAVLTCKEHLVHYYESFGFVNQGVADSVHGGAVWYEMRLIF